MSKIDELTCSECRHLNCYRHDTRYPEFCPTTAMDAFERAELAARYAGAQEADRADSFIAHAAAEVDFVTQNHCHATRKAFCEAILEFLNRTVPDQFRSFRCRIATISASSSRQAFGV